VAQDIRAVVSEVNATKSPLRLAVRRLYGPVEKLTFLYVHGYKG